MSLHPKVLEKLASRPTRLHHYLWHQLRNTWELGALNDDEKKEIEDCGWKPPRPAIDSSGWILSNGAGIDFLFMHRQMIKVVREITENNNGTEDEINAVQGWTRVPNPSNTDYPVPSAWEIYGDPYTRTLKNLKEDYYYYALMREWESKYRDPRYLKGMPLGELGARLESTIHNNMHMRWCDRPWDARTGKQEPGMGRPDTDINDIWDSPLYDWLGDSYSSHVNPVFWKLHGWVDDRIEDWVEANKDEYQINPIKLRGVVWYAGDLIGTEDPWSGGADFEQQAEGDHDHHLHKMEHVAKIVAGQLRHYHFYDEY